MKSIGKKPDGLRLERMKASLLWAGEAFRNVHPVLPGLRDLGIERPTLSEFLCGGNRRVPRGPLPSVHPTEVWSKRPGTGLRATWLGHSTVLIEIDGLRVLTDPVWGSRASPSRLAGPKRFQPVPVALRALPPIDLVLVSHDHYDHLDYPTIRELARREVPFVTSLGVGSHLEAWGVPPQRIIELDWWESHTLPHAELTVTGNAFHPSWGDIHLGPENALEALSLLGGGPFLPVHWGTFSRRCMRGTSLPRRCSRSARRQAHSW